MRFFFKNSFRNLIRPSQIPALDLTKASAKFEIATFKGLGGDAFTRKYIISLLTLTLTLGQGQTQNVAQYPLHHMTYTLAKFEAAMSNGFGGNALTRNIYIKYFLFMHFLQTL